MRRLTLVLIAAVALVPALAAGTPAAAAGTTYEFSLRGPNYALATSGDHAGTLIRVTGSGTFDPVAGTVEASGSFVHYNADGTVHMRGTWVATGFTSFTDFGGPSPDRHGGVLWIVVTHLMKGMPPHTGIPMSVTSAIDAPAGTVAGTTVGEHTVPVSGSSVFSLES